MTQFQRGAGKFGLQCGGVATETWQIGAVDGLLRVGECFLKAAGGFAQFDKQGSGIRTELFEINLIDVPGQAIPGVNQRFCSIQQPREIELLRMTQALLQGRQDAVELAWRRGDVVVLRSPGNRLDGIHFGIEIFKGEDVGAQKPLPLHARAKPLGDVNVKDLLDVFRPRAPNRALWNLKVNENILFLVLRVFCPDEFDGTDFTDGHSAQRDEGADREVFDFARDPGFKQVAFAKIAFQAQGKERSDQQKASRQNKKANSKMMRFGAHATSRFRNCRTHGCGACSRNQDGAPSATIPRIFGSSTMTRSATE